MKTRKCTGQVRQVRRRGAAMVELAIVAPIFFTLLFAGLEFSRVSLVRNGANNAAYQAARRIMVPGATLTDAETEAGRLLGVLGVNTFVLTVTPDPVTPSTDRVTVRIAISARDNGWVSAVFSKDLTLQAGSTLYTERDRGN